MLYTDRSDAGRQLAGLMDAYRGRDAIVLALPRGGVVVGYEIARAVGTELDVLVVRKLGAPHNPEFGFGAIGPGGVRYLDRQSVRVLQLTDEQVEAVTAAETRELRRREREYRGDAASPGLAGRCVIVVDDGLATGGTARAAIRAIREARPASIVLAVPVAPADTADAIEPEVDDLVCPARRADFHAISQWYDSFPQTTDREVIDLLAAARQGR
jgi:predicted phosphoribosyltransferase